MINSKLILITQWGYMYLLQKLKHYLEELNNENYVMGSKGLGDKHKSNNSGQLE